MVQIAGQQVWLTLAADTTQSVKLLWDGDRQFPDGGDTEVRRYANGRGRAVSREGVLQSVSIPAYVTPEVHATLQSWRGRTLLYRDGLGSRWWCVITGQPWQPTLDGRRRRVDLVLAEVTHSEAV